MPSNITRFLVRNKERFGTTDGLPGEFHRKELYAQVKPGARAAFVTTHGLIMSGRVVMRFPTHAVLNLGGRHGTPGVVTPETCIYAAGAKF